IKSARSPIDRAPRPDVRFSAGGRSRPRALTRRQRPCHIPPMSTIRAITVYCGSSSGADPAFVAAARGLGRLLGGSRVRLVYGGGAVGLMGALANSVLDHGGEVTGVIPEFLMSKERRLSRAQEVIVTRDMHERKRVLFERADAFVALPGGIGTLEETI